MAIAMAKLVPSFPHNFPPTNLAICLPSSLPGSLPGRLGIAIANRLA